MDCKEVKAIVSIGCCYNLLSEEGIDKTETQCGFPMSSGVKSAGFSLGKNSRDLACQVYAYLASLIFFHWLEQYHMHCCTCGFVFYGKKRKRKDKLP